MIKIPKELSTKESTRNFQFLSFATPKRPIPISSGKGEAIIKAPTTGASHAKYGVEKILATYGPPSFVNIGFSSSNTRSFKKRKIM